MKRKFPFDHHFCLRNFGLKNPIIKRQTKLEFYANFLPLIGSAKRKRQYLCQHRTENQML